MDYIYSIEKKKAIYFFKWWRYYNGRRWIFFCSLRYYCGLLELGCKKLNISIQEESNRKFLTVILALLLYDEVSYRKSSSSLSKSSIMEVVKEDLQQYTNTQCLIYRTIVSHKQTSNIVIDNC